MNADEADAGQIDGSGKPPRQRADATQISGSGKLPRQRMIAPPRQRAVDGRTSARRAIKQTRVMENGTRHSFHTDATQIAGSGNQAELFHPPGDSDAVPVTLPTARRSAAERPTGHAGRDRADASSRERTGSCPRELTPRARGDAAPAGQVSAPSVPSAAPFS